MLVITAAFVFELSFFKETYRLIISLNNEVSIRESLLNATVSRKLVIISFLIIFLVLSIIVNTLRASMYKVM